MIFLVWCRLLSCRITKMVAVVAGFTALSYQLALRFVKSTKVSSWHESRQLSATICVCPAYAGHTPKAFQIVQKYKFFSFNEPKFSGCYFSRGCKSLTSGLKPRIVSKLARWFIVRYALKEAELQKSVPTNRST